MSKNQEEKENMPPPLGAVPKKATYVTAKLLSIDEHSRLIFTDVKKPEAIKSLIQYGKNKFQDTPFKIPSWLNQAGDTLFKCKLPMFERNNLYAFQNLVGKTLNFKLRVDDYSSDKYGTGIYFTVASPMKEVAN
jgi:hypothetical protein